MKKIIVLLTAASLSALMLAGCGKENNPQESTESTKAQQESTAAEKQDPTTKEYPEEAYVDQLNAADYVTLGDYLGVEVAVAKTSVTDEDVDNYIEYVRANNKVNKEVTGRAVESGDVVDINYEGKRDGVAFDNGSAQNYELEIGSGSFIEGFEDGVIGMKPGETKDLNLTFPETYSKNPDMAGAKVVFTVKLNKIYKKELPAADDAFAAGLGIENVSTMEEFRKYIVDNMEKSAQEQYETSLQSAVLNAVHKNAVFKDVPESLVERYYDRIVNNVTYEASMYGFDLDTYMMYGNQMTKEQYTEEFQKSAQQAAEQVIMLTAIAAKENMTVSDEDMEKDIAARAAEYRYESSDAYREVLGNEMKGYREMLTTERVAEYLVEHAVITEPEAEQTVSGNGTTEEGTEEGTENGTEDTQASQESETAKAE